MKNYNRNPGQSTFLMVGIVSIIVAMMIVVYFNISKINTNAAGSQKARNIAVQAADAGINQFISDVSNRQINIIGVTLPITRNYLIDLAASILTVPVTCDYLKSGGTPVLDLEGNNKYVVDAIATPIIAYGAGIKVPVTRHVQANLSIVNFGRYASFKFSSAEYYANNSDFNGPYHCNGSVLGIGYTAYWNSKTNSSGANNPFYYDDYVTMVAGTFVQAGGAGAANFITQNGARGRLSSDASYSVCPTTSKPSGTWFDKAHGGMKINVRPIPYSTYYNYSQVILSLADLPSFKLNGADVSCTNASNLTIDVGVSGLSGRLKVNINAFGTGSADDIFKGSTNYVAALTSTYGIIIYCVDDVAVYGRIPAVTGSANTNKKIMIVSQKSIEIIGDLLYSGDSYNTGVDSYSTTLTVPSITASNPTSDSIGLICTDNIYINQGRSNLTAFYKNSDDLKIDGFLYGFSGSIAGGGRTMKSGFQSSNIPSYTTFGGQTFDHSGSPPSNDWQFCYDRGLYLNISKLVPVGVGIISWMEIK